MRVNLMSICVFIGAFGLAGLAPAAPSAGGHGGGGAAAHAGAGHASSGHAGTPLGGRISSMGFGTREASELAKMGFVDAYYGRIDGHDATVAVFHPRAPLTVTEREHIYRYHFKGFNECALHGACPESKGGEEMYCRRARNVAITSDLECLSFRRSD
jgi:hypothetical protein